MESLPVEEDEKSVFPERSLGTHSAIVGASVGMGGIAAITQINDGVSAMLNAAGVQTAYSLTSAYIFFEAMQKKLVERADRIGSVRSELVAMFGPAVATTLLNFLLHSLTTFGGEKDPFLAATGTFVMATIWSPIWYVRHRVDQMFDDMANLDIEITEDDMP